MKNKIFNLLGYTCFTILISFLVIFIYTNYIDKDVTQTIKLEKDVTITDVGIADAVDKIYDAVVVIETYNNGKLYATGTGFVYKTDDKYGYIMTNYHVIENGDEVEAIFTNDKKIKTEIVGYDKYQDIAILSINQEDVINVANIGSSDDLRVGDTTFALGAPLDSSIYSWTVTRGILSGKNRLVEFSLNVNYFTSDNYMIEVLQTDTAINSGNSGGPLCNSNGEVIGVTNMKISSSSVEGIGFAIPIENAIMYADKIIKGEKIIRPYLGITMYDIESKNSFYKGVYINSIDSEGSVYNTELEVGDIIIKINDVKIDTSARLKYELYKYNTGDKIKITYLRNNKEYETEITLKNNSTI